jgi:hypothetical protein
VIRKFVLVSTLLAAFAIQAHHSVAGFFDPTTKAEIEGVVKTVRWRNPHTVFEVDVTGADGEVITWRIESGALGVLRSRGIDREFMKVGDSVKIMGDTSLRSDREMFARNILLSDGKEVMMTAGSTPHFSATSGAGLLESEYDAELIAAARRNADGVFRVWSTNLEKQPFPGSIMFRRPLPMTAEAAARRAEFDAADEVLLGCTEWSMPRLITSPLPMEFVRDGDVILQRFEENDNVRRIIMGAATHEAPEENLLLGYSTGRWEGDTLVVKTTSIIPERLDGSGTPFSEEMLLLERYTPSEGGNRLNYTLRVTDPETFTESFEVERFWDWRPEIIVGAYDCDRDQSL